MALAENKEIYSINGISLGIQFQNGTFKAQLLYKEQNADAFWSFWNKKIVVKNSNETEISNTLFKDWKFNPSKEEKKPYFSISKQISNWYSKSVTDIVKDWDSMYAECIKVLDELKKVIRPFP